MGTQILFPTIERWHCIDLILRNLELAYKPKNTSILCAITAGDKYANYVKDRLNKLFKEVTVFRMDKGYGAGMDHNRIRYHNDERDNETRKIELARCHAILGTYMMLTKNMDKNADYTWFIEDDTLFPLDVYTRYMNILNALDGDVVAGVSYHWHQFATVPHNFWKINVLKTPTGQALVKLESMQQKEEGVIKLGAAGLGNTLAKTEVVADWGRHIKEYAEITDMGADISFFHHLEKTNKKAFGVWSVHLPQVSIHEDGNIQFYGKIDKSLIPMLNQRLKSKGEK